MSLTIKRRREITSANVADRWRAQYFQNGEWSMDDKKDIWVKLNDPLNSPDKIDEIIGNSTWTHYYCSACGRGGRPDAVEFKPGDDDYDNINVCKECILSALKAFLE